MAGTTFSGTFGFVGGAPLLRQEQFLQGAEELELAREGHGCWSSHRVDGPFNPAVGRPVDVQDEPHGVQPLLPGSRSDVTR